MNSGPVISNSSPLIGLEQIGQLALLAHLYGQVFAPPAVIRETALSVPRHSWLNERQLTQPLAPPIAMTRCGVWSSLNLPVIGTLGVLLSAKDEGLLTEIRRYVEDLIVVRFYAMPSLIDDVLMKAGEAPLNR